MGLHAEAARERGDSIGGSTHSIPIKRSALWNSFSRLFDDAIARHWRA